MKKIQIEILRLAESFTFNDTYQVVMGEKNGNRRFSIVIGKAEAQAIAVSLDGLKASRPLTHDLLHISFVSFNIEIIEVILTELKEGIYYSYIICKKGDAILEIDARTSDALALALRFDCPVYTSEKLLAEIGTPIQGTIEQFEDELEEDLRGFTDYDLEAIIEDGNEFDEFDDKTLQTMMKKALEEEDYEYAALIRDELSNRKN